MVLKRDNNETLDDTTLDGTQTEETAEIAATVTAIDSRIAAAMEDFFHCL